MNQRVNELKKQIADLQALLAIREAEEQRNEAAYGVALNALNAAITEKLAGVGVPVANIRANMYSSLEHRNVDARFVCDEERSGLDITFNGDKLLRYSVCGISDHDSKGVQTAAPSATFYDNVARVLRFFSSADSAAVLNEVKAMVDNWQAPDLRIDGTPSYQLKSQLRDLFQELERAEIDLKPGAEIEYNDEPPYRTRWNKRSSYWKKVVVVKVTKSTFTFSVFPETLAAQETRKLDWSKIRKVTEE